MTTVTVRVPESMAERLTSAQMRSWLVDFLRRPHSLPPDPGSGEQRVSLTLSREEVLQVAGSLRCSPSVAVELDSVEAMRRLEKAVCNESAIGVFAATNADIVN